MSVAALWDELVGEEGDPLGDALPGPLLGGSPAGGVPYLTAQLDGAYLMVEAAFGADLTSTEPQMWNWYDITTDVRQADGQKVTITPMGRSDEAGQSQPAGCSFQLDNTSGTYTANHPGSTWFPYVRRNTPIRVRLYVNGVWSTRFQGYANGWVPSWDASANLAVVTVSSSGVLRRLNQGKSPLRSALYRALSVSSPIAYWPMEDGSASVRAANLVAGGSPLVPPTTALDFSPAASAPVQFAAVTGPGGSANLPQFQVGSYMAANLPNVATTSWRVDCVLKTPIIPINASPHQFAYAIQLGTTGDIQLIYFQVYRPGDGGFTIAVVDKNNVLSYNPANTMDAGDGNWHYISVRAVQNGAGIDMTVYVDKNIQTYTITPATLQPLYAIYAGLSVSNPAIASIGHIAIWEPTTSVDIFSPATGWAGETATARIARLSSEEGVPVAITGTSDTAMGPQAVDSYLNLIRECETTDDGLLFDGGGPGLGYFARTSRYNEPSSLSPDMAADPPQVAHPFSPADDDQRNRNVIKADRKNGSSITLEDQDGLLGTGTIGTYDSTVTVNTKDDSTLTYRAAHELRKGTVQGFRYPTLSLDLAAAPALASSWLATGLAGRIDVLNVSTKATQHPPGTVSLLLEGYSESLSPFDWTVTANCSPYEPWRVAVVEGAGDTGWRIDSGASVIFRAYSVGDTLIKVSVNDGYLWSTSAGDYPVDIDAGGIQVTVTGVTGSSSPQSFTVAPLAYDIPAGAVVKLWRPAKIAL